MGDKVDDNIYLETMIKIDGPVSSGKDDPNVDEGGTPYQLDFHADEISEASGDEPVGVPSEADVEWSTPSALEKGHSFRDAFESDMDRDSNSESEQAERDMGDRGKDNTTTSMVRRQIKIWFVL